MTRQEQVSPIGIEAKPAVPHCAQPLRACGLDRKSILEKTLARVLSSLRTRLLGRLYCHPLSYGILSEVRTCLLRIRFLYASRLYQPGSLSLGHAAELTPTGRVVPCKETYGRIRDSIVFETRFPWATRVDLALFLTAWDMGAKWGESQQRTQQKDNEASEFQPSPSVYESYTRALQEANEILSHE